MKSRQIIALCGFLFFLAINITPAVYAHSLFNSAEQFIGGYRVQVATLPEFPQIGDTSQILFRVTDENYEEIDRFTMGIRIFYNDDQIDAFSPQSHEGSHWESDYVFENPGNHIFKVDLYNMEGTSGVLTYTFNTSTQSPFGYIFFIAITIGALFFVGMMGYIYLPKIFKKSKL